MKKIVSLFSVVALIIGVIAFTTPSAKALVPAGTLTGAVISVDIGQILGINPLTVTNGAPGDITAALDILIQIPAGVNAIWDLDDVTAVLAGTAAAKANTAVTYDDTRTLRVNVTTNFNGDDAAALATVNGGVGNLVTTTGVANTFTYGADGLYVDTDANGFISIGDRRLAVGEAVAEGFGYAAGTLVIALDTDLGAGANALAVVNGGAGNLLHTTNAVANTFAYGADGLYVDADNGNTVTNGDTRIAVGNLPAEGFDYAVGTVVARDTLIVSGLSFIGHTAATGATALDWSVDGALYGNGNANTQVTVLNGAEDTLTAVTVTPTSAVVGTQTTHALTFTIPTTGVLPDDGQIVITFPVGFTVATAAVTGVTGIDGAFAIALASPVVTLTRDDTGANATVGAKTLTVNLITNHATANSTYVVTIRTNTAAGELLATGNSTAFLINPVAIANLSCISSGSAGAVWLRWTTPVAATGAYVVKTSLATITAGNFDAVTANTFTQAPVWVTGTVGVVQQRLVNALTPNNVYFFNLKAGGAGTSLSAVSNTVFCTAPTAYTAGTGSSDSTAPTSAVTDPTVGQGILAGTAYTIKGTSSDTGGSSVLKVEVSTDGGTTWNIVTPVTSSGTGFTWQYAWTHSIGSYTIKTRATDGFGNIETPSAGTAVVVGTASTLPSVTVTTGGTTTTTTTSAAAATISAMPYASPVGATQINANITYLQGQLLTLLQQLVALLQTQLQALGH
jgi:hypothetical protein